MIPKFKYFIKPILLVIGESSDVISKRKVKDGVIKYLGLSLEDIKATTKSGVDVLEDRVSWGIAYLVKAGMIHRPQKGYYLITDKGKNLLADNPEVITNKILGGYSEEFAKIQYIPKYGVDDKRYKNKGVNGST